MNTVTARLKPHGLLAIENEMARQMDDALASYHHAKKQASEIATSLRETGQLLMLGMGASHAVGRAMEPYYRALGIDAVAVPMSEQLASPLSLKHKTILVSSQSGESAEVVRWLRDIGPTKSTFALSLDAHSTLAKSVPSLIAAGGIEVAFAGTRSLTLTFALHLAVLTELGQPPEASLAIIQKPLQADISKALDLFENVKAIVTSGRVLQGVAEAIALGLMELSRIPAFALEGGQLRHGPMEMLGPDVGVVLFRAQEPAAVLVAGMAQSAHSAGSKVIVFDATGEDPIPNVLTVRLAAASGLAAIFAILPTAQHFMVAFASARVPDVGTPKRSSKITRDE
jgi:fructoselysine-6-P-deglycase FrlB-like protein